MHDNNNGFSLVELIVVVLIMGILIGGASIAFSVARDADSSRASSRVESVFKLARQKALSATTSDGKSCVYAAIYNEGGVCKVGAFIHTSSNVITDTSGFNVSTDKAIEDPIALGNYSISVYVNKKGDWNTNNEVSDGKVYYYTFKRSTGGLNTTLSSNMNYGGTKMEYVDISLVGRDTSKLIIVKETGRIYKSN